MKQILNKNKLLSNEMIVLYFIVVLCTAISLKAPAFFTVGTVFDTARSMLITVMFALCQMMVIVSGGIDVSFPAIANFSLYFTIHYMNLFKIDNVLVAFLISALIGLAWGSVNALLIAKFKIPALIATLGTSSVANGATLLFSKGRDISNIPSTVDSVSQKFLFTLQNENGGKTPLTILIIIPVILIFVVHFIMKHTMLGRKIYAIGGDYNAARTAGINVIKIQFIVYMLVGFVVGIAGMCHTILLRNAHPSNLMGAEMMVIAAVVIGGARITGGHGTVIGTVLGVLLITLVSNNLIMLGIPSHWQTFVVGMIIVIGTSITSLRAKKIALSPKI